MDDGADPCVVRRGYRCAGRTRRSAEERANALERASRAQGTTTNTSLDGALSAPTQLLSARTRT